MIFKVVVKYGHLQILGGAIGYNSPNTILYVNGGLSGNYAQFDSDAGGAGGAEDAALESPTFDCTGLTNMSNYF